MSLTLSATLPITAPITASPALQPSSMPRCSRHARASGLRSEGAAVAGPSRAGRTPAPTSRRANSAKAAVAMTTTNTTARAKTHQRSPA
jgi:hypothetical protein